MTEFEQGVLYAAGVLNAIHDVPTFAADIIREAGLESADCSRMPEYDKNNLREINKSGNVNLKGL